MSIKRRKAEDKKVRRLEVEKKILTAQPLNLSTSVFSTRTPNFKLFFILGGARSGKSAYALKLAESIHGKRLYLATAETLDEEMTERIKKHKRERGNNWTTIEEPIRVADVIRKNNPPSSPLRKGGQGGFNVILLDCLTLWISNLMHEKTGAMGKGQGASIERIIEKFVSACKSSRVNIIIVSNEVGMGIVPDNPLARQFRDIAGHANQKIAQAADEMYFVAAGIPVKIK